MLLAHLGLIVLFEFVSFVLFFTILMYIKRFFNFYYKIDKKMHSRVLFSYKKKAVFSCGKNGEPFSLPLPVKIRSWHHCLA
jgi:hypothetical protein